MGWTLIVVGGSIALAGLLWVSKDWMSGDDWRDRDLCGTDWQVAQRREWIEQQQRGRR